MKNEILEKSDDNNSRVNIGNNLSVSMQVIQDIYNEITGKTEKLSKSYSLNHQTCFDYIKQLNVKMNQLLEQYNVVSNNCSVTLYQVDDQKQQFSSFERFEMYDQSALSAVENVRLEYNYLIILPKISKPQHYKLEIDIHSRAAIHIKANKEHGFPRRIIRYMGSRTANLEIEYVDYTVARNFQTAIDHWFESIQSNKTPMWVNYIQGKSEHIPFFVKHITAFFLTVGFYNESVSLLANETQLVSLFKAGLLAFGVIYILSGVAHKIGILIEQAIDSYQPISYLDLTRGDKNAIADIEKENRISLIILSVNSIFAICLNVFANLISKVIGI